LHDALPICNDCHLLLEWVDRLNMAAYNLLHGFQPLDLPHIAPLHWFHNQYFHVCLSLHSVSHIRRCYTLIRFTAHLHSSCLFLKWCGHGWKAGGKLLSPTAGPAAVPFSRSPGRPYTAGFSPGHLSMSELLPRRDSPECW